ncbi:protein kinase domain-containing protein [Chloroflexus aggregans]|uniref:non-specific serine/threonine protein kinase n=1 Tax=Chloroflexus aggregans (strain MD-66 / DSM 9485) TaxID=326427 RepID=B8G545_CHLAD|nr:protein kinase [Chloroflexus aggregans]ACL23678.1 serine/threonine protein kinase [Chloroflexus aggregans DSM 9485]
MKCPQCGASFNKDVIFCPECGKRIRSTDQPVAASAPLAVLQGRYELRHRLGAGGMGSVYLATDRRLGTVQWAVKEMSDALITSPLDRQLAQEAFRQEAELLAKLNHPYLPRVTDHFEENGRHYLVMEFVPGENLRDYTNRVGLPRPLHEVLRWTAQICEVLAYLHAQQPPIIFRDLKPTNVMITPEGTIKLVDFGIARLFKPGKERDTQVFGTLGYSAPEQYGRGQTDSRSDIYSLGVLMHHLLTGHDPSTTPFRLPPANQLNPTIPTYIVNVITRATESDPSRRFATVIELQQALFGNSGQLVNPQMMPQSVHQAARSNAIAVEPIVVHASTGMASATRWIGIIGVVMMIIATGLVGINLVYNNDAAVLAGIGILIALGAILFALIGGILSVIALVSPKTAKTEYGRRDAVTGFATSFVAFLLCCVIAALIVQLSG